MFSRFNNSFSHEIILNFIFLLIFKNGKFETTILHGPHNMERRTVYIQASIYS